MSLKTKAIIFGVLVLALIAGATGISLWLEYKETEISRQTMVMDVAKVVDMHIKDTVMQVDGLLGEVGKLIVQDGGTGRMVEPGRWEKLGAYCRAISACTFIGVADAQGRSVAISRVPGIPGIDVSDRDFFSMAKQTGKLFVDKAIVTRMQGSPIVFNISKPVYDRDGKLLAIVAAGMNAGHFANFYRLMGFDVSPVVAIFKLNGDVVARNPDIDKYVGRNVFHGRLFSTQLKQAPSGLYESYSELDGQTRIAAYLTVPEFGLVIFAGIEKSSAFSAWRSSALRHVVIVVTSVVLIVFMLAYAYRSLHRQSLLELENQKLDQLSYKDELTGIPNRRAFDVALIRDWERHCRDDLPLSLLMIDIDYFKAFNDCHGHQAGDDCLRKVAQALASSVQRQIDLAARYGGEEFAVLLNTDTEGALNVANRLRSAVESLRIEVDRIDQGRVVTISIGIASTSDIRTQSASELMQCADHALYRAKAAGRNCIRNYSHEAVPDPEVCV